MTILNRYIGFSVIRGNALVLAILLTVFSFLLLVDELDNVGKGQYRLWDAIQFVVLMIPRNIVEFLPVTALLGSLLALGGLASGQELLAMQALGVSIFQISWAVLRVGLLLILLVVGMDEWVAPPLEQQALAHRTLMTADHGFQRTDHGFWARDENRFLHVRTMALGRIPREIDIFQFEESGRLALYTYAEQAQPTARNQWMLTNVVQKEITDRGILVHRYPSLTWEPFVSQDQMDLLLLPPDSLSYSDLSGYIQFLRESRQNVDRYELALWKKGTMPLATGTMVLLAIPFVFGPFRQGSMGQRVMVGSIIGLAFYFGSQIIEQVGLLFSVHPAVTALGPSGVVLAVAFELLRRVRG